MARPLNSRSRTRSRTRSSNKRASAVKESEDFSLGDDDNYPTEVLTKMLSEGVVPTPNNYAMCFERLLETKSESFKNKMIRIIKLDENNNNQGILLSEQGLKEGFLLMRKILSVSSNLYKNMSMMNKVLEKRRVEREANENQDATKITTVLKNDIEKLDTILQKQNSIMKEHYTDTATVLKNYENEVIIDKKYNIYNKRYFLLQIEKEKGLIKEFKYKSTLIMIEIDKDFILTINNKKTLMLITKTLIKLLTKISRRGDLLAHYGERKFAMLLTHTNLDTAQGFCTKLCAAVTGSNFFLGDREVTLRTSMGITNMDIEKPSDELISNALNGIKAAYKKDDVNFAVSTS
ncbi:MAG: diguanylate cyclase [Campylobacterota bacterium]|nr:diguanylate cyclase [Campylobacterota bacterium]